MTQRLTADQAAAAYAKGKHTQPETAILRQCAGYLRAAGWFTVRLQQGLGCHRGISDLVCMRGGRTVWVEVKSPTGRLSDWQDAYRLNVTQAGGEYVVVRSLDDAIAMSGETVR